MDINTRIIEGRPASSHPRRMEPAAHGFCRDLDAMFGLERCGEGGTTPPGTAPPIGPRGGFEYGTQGAREPRHQKTRLDGHREPAIWVDPYAKAPDAIRVDDPVDTRARAKQKGRNLRGVSAHCTQQSDATLALNCSG
jgi:hypothetical protein